MLFRSALPHVTPIMLVSSSVFLNSGVRMSLKVDAVNDRAVSLRFLLAVVVVVAAAMGSVFLMPIVSRHDSNVARGTGS